MSTEPSEYLVSAACAATSTASEMAMPSEPGCFGFFARIAFPDCVWSDGEGMQRAPYVSISARRYGFWSYDTRTMKTCTSMPKTAPANASDEPHCPAPVSVESFLTPASRL